MAGARGVVNMSKRAEEIRASLSIESELSKGTRVTVVLSRLTDRHADRDPR